MIKQVLYILWYSFGKIQENEKEQIRLEKVDFGTLCVK